MKKLLFFLFFGGCNFLLAQTGIGTNTPNASAQLDISATNKGLLIPRMTQAEMNSVSNPVAGLQVYNTTKGNIYTYNGTTWIGEKKFIGKFVAAGNAISLDNIQIRIPSTGNTAIQLATVSGSINLSGSSMNVWYNSVAPATGASTANESFTRQSESFNTTFTAWQAGAHFTRAGGNQVVFIMDETNSKAYKLTFICGANSSSHYLEIEQML